MRTSTTMPQYVKQAISLCLISSVISTSLIAQQPSPTSQQQVTLPTAPMPVPTGVDSLRPNYTLGPGDQIIIRAKDAEELSERPYRIDADGKVQLPILGELAISGMTVEAFQQLLNKRLQTYIRDPQAIVTIVQFRSEPVFFVGALKAPGIYPLQGRRTLVEMLSSIGGLQPGASRRLQVTRRKEYGPIPLPNVTDDADGRGTIARISLASLKDSVNPAEDIVLQPFDVISIERAELVYTGGEIGKVGGYELGERDSISVVQILSLSGGIMKDGDAAKARILRPVLSTSRRAELPINVKRILEGKDPDVPLLPNDLLYIPRNQTRAALTRVGLIVLPLAVSVALLSIRQ